MATTSQRLKTIRLELQAQKVAFAQLSSTLPLHTENLTYNTKKNACHVHDLWYPGSDYDYDGYEQVILTLDTPAGENTLASLEITGNYDLLPTVRRIPYTGGARWSIISSPRFNPGDHSWLATTYNFTVQTLVDGTLSAKMIWEV